MYLFTSQISQWYLNDNFFFFCEIAMHTWLKRFLALQTGFEMAKGDFDILIIGTALPQIFIWGVDDTHI